MKNKQYILAVLACLIPIAAGLLLYNDLPEMMPVHFNGTGIADGYAPKAVAVFVLPLFMAMMEVFCLFIMNADPKKSNYPRQLIGIVVWMVPVLSCAVNGIVLLKAMGADVRVEVLMPVMVGILLVVMGNYLPKTRQNYTLGIKLPWTLNSEENWRKTHRFGGFLFVISGLWMIVTALLKVNWTVVILIPVVLIAFLPMIYSWVLYQKEKDHVED